MVIATMTVATLAPDSETTAIASRMLGSPSVRPSPAFITGVDPFEEAGDEADDEANADRKHGGAEPDQERDASP